MDQQRQQEDNLAYGEAVTVRVKIELLTGAGEKIYEGGGIHHLPGILGPDQLTTSLKRFAAEWKVRIADPVFAALDAFRRQRYEEVKTQLPMVDYPAQIDLMEDARQTMATFPMSDLADQEKLAKIRRGSQPPRQK